MPLSISRGTTAESRENPRAATRLRLGIHRMTANRTRTSVATLLLVGAVGATAWLVFRPSPERTTKEAEYDATDEAATDARGTAHPRVIESPGESGPTTTSDPSTSSPSHEGSPDARPAPSGVVRGTVVDDATGEPIADARVWKSSRPSDAEGPPPPSSAT